jgi:DNA uptake protein ComE-like DNA-binding protein
VNARALLLSALCVSLAAAGCSAPAGEVDPEATPSEVAAALTAVDAATVLDFVNYPGTDLALLDGPVGLDSRAAKGIVAARDGDDGVSPSADDVPFAGIAALDAVPYVGDAAFAKLQAYASAHPAPKGETVEGVTFAGWESQAVVYGVDHATLADLDALLDDRAAQALFDHRPFATVTAMGPEAYVGASALTALRGHAGAWWAAMNAQPPSLAGTFDGVTFDAATAPVALAIANQATLAQLEANHVAASPAGAVVGGRPYATLAAVAAVKGVGQATMQALLDYAKSGAWGASCTTTFDGAVGPHLGDLLFMSESDRPLTLVAYPNAGASAPTAASVLALVGAPAGSTAELRDPANFYGDLEASSSTADPAAPGAIQSAFEAQLTDVVYVAVIPPAGTPDHSLVQVYLVGRTSCGDLVGLTSISVET